MSRFESTLATSPIMMVYTPPPAIMTATATIFSAIVTAQSLSVPLRHETDQ